MHSLTLEIPLFGTVRIPIQSARNLRVVTAETLSRKSALLHLLKLTYRHEFAKPNLSRGHV
jgi:hypothetical protein